MQRAGLIPIGTPSLVTMMPKYYSEALYGTTEPVELVGKTHEELADALLALREKGYKEAELMLGQEEQAQKNKMGCIQFSSGYVVLPSSGE